MVNKEVRFLPYYKQLNQLIMETNEENKLLFLRNNYKSTDKFIVTWGATYINFPKRYTYDLCIKLANNNQTVLYKSSYDYNYLIELYNLFMKKI